MASRTAFLQGCQRGRSVWNSKWKLIIAGHTLLNDPGEGLDRFIRTVKDAKLTYSCAGN